MSSDPTQSPMTDRRRRGIVGEIATSLARGNADRRYGRWSVSGVLVSVAILAGFAGVIWMLARLVFSG